MKNIFRFAIVFSLGGLFALGLVLSGMTMPQKVVGFLDILGDWDPSLAFVMVGAIGVHALLYPLITRRNSPVLEDQFQIPSRKDLDPSLLLGAALFGIGWGIGGFCPGPGIVSASSGQSSGLVFAGSMLLGMFLFKLTKPLIDRYLP